MKFFVHPQGICESERVGEGTRIWAFAHVLAGAALGRDCNICDHVFIENDVVLGDRVTVKSGVQLWDGVTLEDDVFIGPNATFSNDKFPRSKAYLDQVERTYVCKGASIGANSTILPGLRIGREAMIGAGTVVTRDVPPFSIVTGNPGRITGYVDSAKPAAAAAATVVKTDAPQETVETTSVPGVTLHHLSCFADLRGKLYVGDMDAVVPFVPRRFFIVNEVPSKYVRGEHAHKQCEQMLVCVGGSLAVVVDDGNQREEIILDRPDVGLYVPPMVWATQYQYTHDAVLFVFASHPYDADDYIRDYEEFLRQLPEQE